MSVPLPSFQAKARSSEEAGINSPVTEKFLLPPAVENVMREGRGEKENRSERRDKKEKKLKKEKKDKRRNEKERKDLDLRKFFKVGQKYLTPSVADATRAFYTSLFEENPESKIAISYLVENGILGLEKHRRLYKKYERITKDSKVSKQESKSKTWKAYTRGW